MDVAANRGSWKSICSLSAIMAQLSLFQRLSVFVNGVFDLTAIVYYVSVIVFFLFLSVQSLEKRRYN